MTRFGVVTAVLLAAAAWPATAAGAGLTALQRAEIKAHADALVLTHDKQAQLALRAAGGVRIARGLPVWRVGSGTALRVAARAHAVQPNRWLPATGHFSAGDPLVPNQWWIAAIRADAAEPPGPGKPVTVIDSGVDAGHEEFAGRPATTYLNDQFVVGQMEEHGTAVASVIGAPANARGVVGVYPQAALQIWDASPSGAGILTSEVIAGVDAAVRRGAGVINLSLGSPARDPVLEALTQYAFRNSVLVVAAAGNDRHRGNPLEYPASFPHVLTVGAIDQSGRPAFFSSSSPFVDVVAPGFQIPVAVPRNAYGSFSGTSFAAPLAAGVAAWAWTLRPGLDATQVFDLMRAAAQDVEAPGHDPESGFGRVDVPSVLSRREPVRDPHEPNEDLSLILPRRLFRDGVPPLTTPARSRGSLLARLDPVEDSRDVYRVWVPARRVTAVSLTPLGGGNVNLALWGPRTRSVLETGSLRRRDLKRTSRRRGARRESVLVRNTSRRGSYHYVEAVVGESAPRAVGRLSYRIVVSTAPLRRRARR